MIADESYDVSFDTEIEHGVAIPFGLRPDFDIVVAVSTSLDFEHVVLEVFFEAGLDDFCHLLGFGGLTPDGVKPLFHRVGELSGGGCGFGN